MQASQPHHQQVMSTALLRAREPQYRLLFEGASDAIFLSDLAGVVTAANPSACRLVGLLEDDLLGRNATDLCPPEWKDRVTQYIGRLAKGKDETSVYEMTMIDSRGTRIPVEIRANVLREAGAIVGIHAIVRDVRDRRRSEIALRESEDRFRGAFDTVPVGMSLGAIDGRWLRVNEALCRILGYSEDELLNGRFQDVTHPDDLDADVALGNRMLAGESSSYQMDKRFIHKDGSVIPVHLCVSLVRGADGTPAYSVAQILQVEADRDRVATPADNPLSPRERQVLALLADGRTSAEAALQLSIGEETVQTHVRRAMKKLAARTRTHAVAQALASGWLELQAETAASA